MNQKILTSNLTGARSSIGGIRQIIYVRNEDWLVSSRPYNAWLTLLPISYSKACGSLQRRTPFLTLGRGRAVGCLSSQPSLFSAREESLLPFSNLPKPSQLWPPHPYIRPSSSYRPDNALGVLTMVAHFHNIVSCPVLEVFHFVA